MPGLIHLFKLLAYYSLCNKAFVDKKGLQKRHEEK